MAVPNRGRWRPWVVTMLVALGVWWAVALTIAGRDAAGRIADLVAGEVAVQTRTNTGVAYSIAAGLRHLRGIPLALAGDAGVMAATASFGAGIPTSSLPVAERRRWLAAGKEKKV